MNISALFIRRHKIGLLILYILFSSALFGKKKEAPATPAGWGAPAKAGRWKNPFTGNPDHVQAGKRLFERYCASCHGKGGEGIGKAVCLNTTRVEKANAGELFWFLRNGDSRKGMPAWSRLPDPQIWQLVTFMQRTVER